MKNIADLSFKNQNVLIRVDFNVPLNNDFSIADDSRMVAALPTINKVISSGGKAIILSHLGRPKGVFTDAFSLKHIVSHLSFLLKKDVFFISKYPGESLIKLIANSKSGSIFLLENLRFNAEEKKGGKRFAQELSSLGDWYINDAFGALHRAHASTAIIADFFNGNKCFGFLINKELLNLKKVTENPSRPLTAIIGGAKISGKIDVIKSLFDKVDNLIIGGGMAYTFIKSQGGKTSNSIVENEKLDLADFLIKEAKKRGVNLLLPVDSVNGSLFNNSCKVETSDITKIPDGFMGLDIGPKTIATFKTIILNSKTIIWNGPMGVFEMSNFSVGTKEIGNIIALATKNGAFSLVGGGDSVAAIKKFNLANKVSYISTGGGAMLEYLEGAVLPGISAIEN